MKVESKCASRVKDLMQRPGQLQYWLMGGCRRQCSATRPPLPALHPPRPALRPAAELRREVRQQFEAHRQPRDQQAIKFLLSEGRLKLKQLGEMLGMQL